MDGVLGLDIAVLAAIGPDAAPALDALRKFRDQAGQASPPVPSRRPSTTSRRNDLCVQKGGTAGGRDNVSLSRLTRFGLRCGRRCSGRRSSRPRERQASCRRPSSIRPGRRRPSSQGCRIQADPASASETGRRHRRATPGRITARAVSGRVVAAIEARGRMARSTSIQYAGFTRSARGNAGRVVQHGLGVAGQPHVFLSILRESTVTCASSTWVRARLARPRPGSTARVSGTRARTAGMAVRAGAAGRGRLCPGRVEGVAGPGGQRDADPGGWHEHRGEWRRRQ